MVYLFEGLKEGDLEGLVLPLVSIDEFESKLDDDSIVVAFYVQDRDPAGDLNRFIQKGAISILDTDVSPAPNEDGHFIVFVEFLRDQDFPQKLVDTFGTLTGLTHIENWKATIYDVEEPIDVTTEALMKMVRLVPIEAELDDQVEVKEFFKPSDLNNLIVEGNHLTLEGRYSTFEAILVDFGPLEELKERNVVLSQGLRLDETAQHNVSRLSRLLGDMWLVEHLQNHVVLSCVLNDNVALLRL